MSLAELRDLFIIIFAVLGIGATVFFTVIAFLILRRVLAILNSGRMIAGNIRSITSAVSQDLVKPLASIASVAQGVAKVLEFFSDRRKERRKGD
jgi:hypothetical protein